MPYGSYRRGYSRGYGASLPTGGPNVKRFLVGSYTSLATGNTGNIAINVPIDAAAGRFIQIWSVEVEFSDGTWFVVDNKHLAVVLARTAGTAERYVNDPDVLCKFNIHSELATNGTEVISLVFDKDMYPAIPLMGPQVHCTITNDTGATQNIYVKIWYTDLFAGMAQTVAMLQSQVM